MNKKDVLDAITQILLDNHPSSFEILNVELKDYDDENGFIGEHFIVEFKDKSKCLIDRNEVKKMIDKKKIITWL